MSLLFIYFSLLLLTFISIQVMSLAYHAATGHIALGFDDGQVEFWQTDTFTAPQVSSAPQASSAAQTAPKAQAAPKVPLPNNACVRKRLTEAQAQVKDIKTSLEKADSGLRQQMSREQELKRSIANLEAKRAHLTCLFSTNSS